MPADRAKNPTPRSPKKGNEEILVADRYQILPDSPISDFELSGGKAFAVRDKRSSMSSLVARVCDKGVLPRLDVAVQLHRLVDTNVVQPRAWGPVYWTPEGRHAYCVIFDRPESGPLMPTLDTKVRPINAENIIRNFLAPAAMTLALFVRHGLTHRAIRPDNLFFESGSTSRIILGECVSTPPGWGQPLVTETIEMGMTPNWGRGRGSVSDDLYSLGVSILFLALGFSPVVEMSDKEILASKVRNGSFAALLNSRSPPAGLREVIRGLLADSPAERWKIEDIEQWLTGDLRRSVQPRTVLQADRGFDFDGTDYRECRALAHAFGEKWQIAAHAVTSPDLHSWVTRGVDDTRLTEALNETLFLSRRSSEYASEGRLLTVMCMVLDPWGPIRYNGLILMPEALGTALATALMNGQTDTVQQIAEVIGRGIPNDWFRYRAGQTKEDFTFSLRAFKRLQQLLKATGPGFGIERCLYELGSYTPCLSKMTGDTFIYAVGDVLPALEEIVAKKGKLDNLIDRHLLAFIAARLRGKVEDQLAALEGARNDPLKSKLAMIGLLAKLQREFGPESLPSLTKWLVAEVEPATARFNSRTMREKFNKALAAIGVSGNLTEFPRIGNNTNRLKQDGVRREASARVYARADKAAV